MTRPRPAARACLLAAAIGFIGAVIAVSCSPGFRALVLGAEPAPLAGVDARPEIVTLRRDLAAWRARRSPDAHAR